MGHQSENASPTPPSVKAGAEASAAYDRWSRQYDNDRNTTRDLDAQILRVAPIEVSGRVVLELGCGTGKNTAWLAAGAKSVTALDFSAGMLSVARERVSAKHVSFVQHDVRNPWPPAYRMDSDCSKLASGLKATRQKTHPLGSSLRSFDVRRGSDES